MTKRDRAINIIWGIGSLVFCSLLLLSPYENYVIIVNVIDLFLLIYAIRQLFYYFMMTRFMVGGMIVLYRGILVLDLSIFIYTLNDAPRRIMMLCFIGMLALAGVIDIFQALDRRKTKTSRIYNLLTGLFRISIGVVALFSLDSALMMTILFCITFISYSITRFTEAFKKTAIVYPDW